MTENEDDARRRRDDETRALWQAIAKNPENFELTAYDMPVPGCDESESRTASRQRYSRHRAGRAIRDIRHYLAANIGDDEARAVIMEAVTPRHATPKTRGSTDPEGDEDLLREFFERARGLNDPDGIKRLPRQIAEQMTRQSVEATEKRIRRLLKQREARALAEAEETARWQQLYDSLRGGDKSSEE